MEVVWAIVIVLLILIIWGNWALWYFGWYSATSSIPILARLQTTQNWIRADQAKPVPYRIELLKTDPVTIKIAHMEYGYAIKIPAYQMTGQATQNSLTLTDPVIITPGDLSPPVRTEINISGNNLIMTNTDKLGQVSRFLLTPE